MPSFLRGLIKPSLSQLVSQDSMEPQPVFNKFPFSCQMEVALLTQNGALQGLDESVPEEDISCRDTPVNAIDVDETVFKNGERERDRDRESELHQCRELLPERESYSDVHSSSEGGAGWPLQCA